MNTDFSAFEPPEEESNKYLSTFDNYVDFLFPKLQRDEQIALFVKNDAGKVSNMFLESKEDLKSMRNYVSGRVLFNFNVHISLSTCVTVNNEPIARKAENMNTRFCVAFDFDKKDFKKLKNIEDFVKHFKDTTSLWVHFAVDSGNGYHFYVGIEETKDITKVAEITKRFAILSGADTGNVSAAQTLRLPCTINHKNPDVIKAVNIVFGYHNNENFRRYTLDYLESKANQLEREKGITCNRSIGKTRILNYMKGFKCVANMIERGAVQGDRNKCMGRIVTYFRDIARLTHAHALDEVLRWHKKCSGAEKTTHEITKDFNRYWKKSYKLLGCSTNDARMNSILEKYCEKNSCARDTEANTVEVQSMDNGIRFFILDKRYATDECLRVLNGCAYLIVKMLSENKEPLKVKDLVELTGCSKQTIGRAVSSLLELGLVNECGETVAKYKVVYKARKANKTTKNISLPVQLFDMLKNKEISDKELVTYIAIRRNAYLSQKCTYEELGKVLGINKINVYKTVKKRMVRNGLLEIEPRKTGRSIKVSEGLTLELGYNFYHFPLEVSECD